MKEQGRGGTGIFNQSHGRGVSEFVGYPDQKVGESQSLFRLR